MKLEKKIELQAKIIHELQEENASLVERIKELERIVNDNEKIIDTAKTYRDEHEKCIASLNEIKEKYVQATKDIAEQKRKYKSGMEALLKTIKKNI